MTRQTRSVCTLGLPCVSKLMTRQTRSVCTLGLPCVSKLMTRQTRSVCTLGLPCVSKHWFMFLAFKKLLITVIELKSLIGYIYYSLVLYRYLEPSPFQCLSLSFPLSPSLSLSLFSFLYSLFLPIENSLAPWCDVCGGSSSLLTTDLVA